MAKSKRLFVGILLAGILSFNAESYSVSPLIEDRMVVAGVVIGSVQMAFYLAAWLSNIVNRVVQI